MTGLTEAEWHALLPHVEPAFVTAIHDRTLEGQPRTRRRSSTDGPCPWPTIADQLLGMVSDVQQPPIQAVQGTALWEVAVACAYRASSAPSWMASGRSRSRATADSYGRRLGGEARDATDSRSHFRPPWWHDGTARPMQRPTDPAAPQAYDRGKKTGHTRKHRLVIHEMGDSCCWSHPDEANASEPSVAERSGSTVPPGSDLYPEKGCQGFCLHGITIVQPQRTPPGADLTPPEKATHRRMASIRIRIEPAIGGVKRDSIVKDTIRLLTDGIRDTVMETCGGLHNFRLQYRPWHYASY